MNNPPDDIIDRINRRFATPARCRWPKSGTPYWVTVYWLVLLALCVAREVVS